MGSEQDLPADWLAQEFAAVDAEIAKWPEGLRRSFQDSYGQLVVVPASPQPPQDVRAPGDDTATFPPGWPSIDGPAASPAPADDVAAQKQESRRTVERAGDIIISRLMAEKNAAEAALAEAKAELETWKKHARVLAREGGGAIGRLTADRDRLAEAARWFRDVSEDLVLDDDDPALDRFIEARDRLSASLPEPEKEAGNGND